MELEDYILKHIDAEPQYLAEISRTTHLKVLNPRMLSGHLQGRVLAMISKMLAPKCILELGTFTGYSALCLAEGLTENGVLHTVECDDELESFIRGNFDKCPQKYNIHLHIGNALDVIPTLNEEFDLVFMDADKREYKQYFDLVINKIKSGGIIIADNTLWDGKVLKELIAEKDEQTMAIKEFNRILADDERVEKVILPFRDGLTLVRKK